MKMIQTEILNLITKKTLGLTLVLSAAAIAFAQEKQQISGKIVDAQNNAVPYASISFSNKTVKENAALFSDATLTDEKGNFIINLIPGNYEITIDAVDFKKLVVTKSIGQNPNLGNIKIESEQQVTNAKTKDIEGVTLTSTAKPYKIELDKRTYDVNQDIISKGGSLQDVLQNVPSISVDTDGTVSMRGSSNVRFLINGKPSALLGIDDGANALQSIPADQIDRIEVITNPSSKFEASGTAGILNIILKKNKKIGLNGSVTGTLGYLPQTNLNTNLSIRKGNLTWFLNGGGGYRESKNTNTNKANYFNAVDPKDRTSFDLESVTKNKNKNYNASTGFIYDINEKTSVNMSGTVRKFNSENTGDINYDYYFLDGTQSFTKRENRGNNDNLALQGDFGLDHKFDNNGQNISLSLSLQKNKSENDTHVDEKDNNILVLEDKINQNTTNKNVIGKVDYELPIGDKSKLEAGYRLDINSNNYSNDVQERLSANSNFAYLPKYTYDADYKETFNAAYIQFKSKIGNLGYQLGLRNEYSNIDIKYQNLIPTDNIDKNKSYNNLFPSVFLSYEITKSNQILVNYSKRIDRPRSFFMIPNPSYSDNQNIFLGNIDLNPSYVDSFELGYSISKNKLTINPTLYFKHTEDDVKMLVFADKGVFNTKPINLGTNDRYGLDLNFNWEATKWLRLMGNFDLFGYTNKGIYFDSNILSEPISFEGSGLSVRSRITTSFKVDKTFNFQLQGFYRGAENTKSTDRRDMYAINFGASKTVLKGNGTITFNIQDIFNTRAMRNVTRTAEFTRENYMQWQPRQFALSFSYRFKQGEKVDQPKKKKDINSNDQGGDDQMPPM
jgi:hypothetical protein